MTYFQPFKMSGEVISDSVSECPNLLKVHNFRVMPLRSVKPTVCTVRVSQNFCSGVCVPTAGEELRSDGGNELALQRLGVGALCVLDHNVPLFDPSQQPQKVAVTQQVRCLKLPVDV